MAINYSSVDIRGVAADPILAELMFQNQTINEGLVTFEDDVKAETIFTEASAEAVMQQYTSGAPSPDGELGGFDAVVSPTKVMYYQEFDPDKLRFSRYKRDMPRGAWNVFSNEFERLVIGGVYANKISLDAENKFWTGATQATKDAVAGLTPGTNQNEISAEEQALIASMPTTLFDGVIAKAIYNNSNENQTLQVGGRRKVVGTTITSSNIKDEYDKLYADIDPVNLSTQSDTPYIYAPRGHKQLINIFNNNPANYKDAFDVSDDKSTYYYNGIEIKFVPIPDNTMWFAMKGHTVWCTDLQSDINTINMDKIANNREDMFLKSIFTIKAHVRNQSFNTLYVG